MISIIKDIIIQLGIRVAALIVAKNLFYRYFVLK